MLRQKWYICVRHLARIDGGKTIKTLTFGKLEGKSSQDQNSGAFTVQKKSKNTGVNNWQQKARGKESGKQQRRPRPITGFTAKKNIVYLCPCMFI